MPWREDAAPRETLRFVKGREADVEVGARPMSSTGMAEGAQIGDLDGSRCTDEEDLRIEAEDPVLERDGQWSGSGSGGGAHVEAECRERKEHSPAHQLASIEAAGDNGLRRL